MGSIKHCYAGGNTNIGFYSLFNEMTPDLERLYLILGSTGSLKSAMIEHIGQLLNQKGYTIEYLHSLFDFQAVEGLVVPELKLGIIDGNTAHPFKPQYPGARDRYINFGDYWIMERVNSSKEKINHLSAHIQNLQNQIYKQFALAKKYHEQKEKIYISAMNFTKANQITDQLMEKIFSQSEPVNDPTPDRHFFLGASTSEGPINHIENITMSIEKRYIIKGRSGSGKSTIRRKIAKKAKDLGLGVEYYHCSFDPMSLDMVTIPALSIAILDGTSPHVIDPSRIGDEVVDMFLISINPQVEVEHEEELHKLDQMYRTHVQTGTTLLQEVKGIYDQLDEIYRNAIDLKGHQLSEKQWITEILQYVEEYK